MKTWRATITRMWFTSEATKSNGMRSVVHLELSTGETIHGRPGASSNYSVHPGLVGQEFEITTDRSGSFFNIEI
jgi:hypothetical protein